MKFDEIIKLPVKVKNKIDPSVIGDIDNICITKRSINRKKSILSEVDFRL